MDSDSAPSTSTTTTTMMMASSSSSSSSSTSVATASGMDSGGGGKESSEEAGIVVVEGEDDVDEGPPVLQNFTGKWKVNDARSDRLDAFFQALGVNWFARKIVCAVDASYQIQHTPAAWDQKDITRFGTHHARYLLDGQYHDVPQPGGKVAPARAWQSDTGDVIIETRLPDTRGTTVDCRRLVSRTRLQQILSVWREGRMDHQSKREWTKLETARERRAAREMEAKARHEAAKSTVTSSGLCMFGMWRAKAQQARRQSATSATSGNTANRQQTKQQGANTQSNAVDLKDVRGPSAPVLHADFTGDWHIDWKISQKMGPYLKEIGVPWYARGIAESLDITSKMKHLPYDNPATLESEDSSKFGAQTTQFVVDCEPRTVTGDDGKTVMRIVEPLTLEALQNGDTIQLLSSTESQESTEATADNSAASEQKETQGQRIEVHDPFRESNTTRSLDEGMDVAVPKWTASLAIYKGIEKQLFKKPWEDGIKGEIPEERKKTVSADFSKSGVPIVGMRMTTVLPDNVGVTIETRHLTRNGKYMRQIHDLFREGQHKVRVERYLENHAFEDQLNYLDKLIKARKGDIPSPTAAAKIQAEQDTKVDTNLAGVPVPSAGGLQDDDTIAKDTTVVEEEEEEEDSFSDVDSGPSDNDDETTADAKLSNVGPKPVHTNFSGVWEVDWGRSQRLDALFKAMGLNWLARKFVSALDIKYYIAHTPIEWYVREVSSVGVFQLSVLLDGRWHLCKQQDGSRQPMKVTQDFSTGDIEIETMLIYDSHNPKDTKEVVKKWEKKGAQAALELARDRPRTISTASSHTSGSQPGQTSEGSNPIARSNSTDTSSNSKSQARDDVDQSEQELECEEELWSLLGPRCGRLLDVKHLQERTVIRQVLMYETADGVARHAVTRFLMKVETASERLAAMRLENQRAATSAATSQSKHSLKVSKRQDSADSRESKGKSANSLTTASPSCVSFMTVVREWLRNEDNLSQELLNSASLIPEAVFQGAMDLSQMDDNKNRVEEGSSLCVLFALFLILLFIVCIITGTPLIGGLVISLLVMILLNAYHPLRKRLKQNRRNSETEIDKKER